ncbi:MAG TPA: polysaccharide deacetylase family protein, partial [Gemmatimonadota bacterium]|nr:polysaccharide deacetylase family protein [Gemmatimonadota bacterium]
MGRQFRRVPAMLGMGRDLLRGRYPSFVYGREPRDGELPPIFTFHATTAQILEPMLVGLARAGYRGLTCDEYLTAVRGEQGVDASKAVMLTFDDGHASVWSVVRPLLERYDMRAVVYLIPGRIQDGPESDDAAGGDRSLCTWPQIVEMHETGRIDFQSHTLLHHRVFTDARLRDFVGPELLVRHPHDLLLWDGPDPADRELPVRPSYPPPPLGAPVYGSRPRMLAARAFHEDVEVRRACVERVEEGGGVRFFESPNWRRSLAAAVREQRKRGPDRTRVETPQERDRALRADLERARAMIERRLEGKRVRHLAWPWGVASDAAVAAAC